MNKLFLIISPTIPFQLGSFNITQLLRNPSCDKAPCEFYPCQNCQDNCNQQKCTMSNVTGRFMTS